MSKERTYDQKKKLTKILKNIAKGLAVCFLFLLISGMVQAIVNAVTVNYAFDIITNRLTRAEIANNLDLMALYAQETLDMIADKSGNPTWFFPLEKTDWDVLKLDLSNIISTIETASVNCPIGSDAYEEALRIGKLSLNAISGRIDDITWATLMNNKEVAGGIGGYAIGAVAILIAIGILNLASPKCWFW